MLGFNAISLSIGFALTLNVLGIYTNLDTWSWRAFGCGFLIGLPIISLWWSHRIVGKVLTVGSVISLAYIAIIGVETLEFNRVVFNGLFIGTAAGVPIAMKLYKEKALLMLCTYHSHNGSRDKAEFYKDLYQKEVKK